MASWKYGQPGPNSALLQNFCLVLGETVSLQFDFRPARVRSSTSTTLWRVAGCGNYVRESELYRLCQYLSCVAFHRRQELESCSFTSEAAFPE